MRILLHLGQHKTGSKALQSVLFANSGFLANGGYSYPVPRGFRQPRPYELNHFPLFQAVRNALTTRGPGRAAVAALHAPLRRLLTSRRAGRNTIPAGDVHTVILSAEDLFDMHTAHEADFVPDRVAAGAGVLAEALQPFTDEIRLVVYLRRQDHLLGAHYAEFIKGTGHEHPDLDDFHRRFAGRLDSAAILSAWETAFGAERILVRPYEPRGMPGGIVGDFFGRVLGLAPPPVTVPFPRDLEAFNITPSRDQIEFMRCLNRRCARGKRVLHRAPVLESAFREGRGGRRGIEAWCSPAERAALLERHALGNRRIANRYGLGDTLFEEPAPDTDAAWSPPAELDLATLVGLDTRARAATSGLPLWRRLWGRLRQRWRGRQMWWVVPPTVGLADRDLATRSLAGLIGAPELEPRLVPSLAEFAVPADQRPVAMVVLAGCAALAAVSATAWRALRNQRVRVVLLLAEVPVTADAWRTLRTVARDLSVVRCATRDVRDRVVQQVPETGPVASHQDLTPGDVSAAWLEEIAGI